MKYFLPSHSYKIKKERNKDQVQQEEIDESSSSLYLEDFMSLIICGLFRRCFRYCLHNITQVHTFTKKKRRYNNKNKQTINHRSARFETQAGKITLRLKLLDCFLQSFTLLHVELLNVLPHHRVKRLLLYSPFRHVCRVMNN